ncbi:hypothetical protein [Streptomyces sp. NPDC020983]|uniref:hypothetical protein n=1 Tax=Streptomyces sp. NPDC020983 TaxID=3365106 RepID=UPI0037A01EC1
MRAPVRIADAGAVRLLRPGDLVDVLAAGRVVASGVSVVAIPEEAGGTPVEAPLDTAEGEAPPAEGAGTGGALVVLSVSRGVAAALSGAAASNPLAVTLC